MKKIFKTLLALCPALLLSFLLVLTSCGVENEQNTQEPTEETESEYLNLYEYKCKFLMGEIIKDTHFGYMENTVFCDLALARAAEIEENCNCTITNEMYQSNVPDYARLMIASGKNYADVAASSHGPMWQLTRDGSFLPLDEVSDVIDLSDYDKWGGPNIYGECMSEGKLYTFAPAYWPMMYPQFYYATVFNTSLVADFGMGDPRELVENGTWNREAFESYVYSCADTERGIYGLTCCGTDLVYMALLANNADVYEKDASGEYVYALRDSAALNALEWVKNFINNNSDKISHPYSSRTWGEYNEIFCKENASLLVYPLWGIIGQGNFGSTVYMSLDNYGWLPFPNGPDREYGDWAAFLEGDSSIHALGVLTVDPEVTAYIVDLMYEPFEEFYTQEQRDAWYKENLFFDGRDYEIFKKQCENASYIGFKEIVSKSSIWADLASSMKTGSYIETIDKAESIIQEIIDSDLAVNAKALDKYTEQFEQARALRVEG